MPAPPGVVMLAPPEVPRNASRAQSEGRAKEDVATRRGQGQYKGRSTVGSRQSKGSEPVSHGSSDPLREAGAPSTLSRVVEMLYRDRVPCPLHR